ncbi:hypothetical protein [Halotalea alkalilenta]|uniref:hypothetical protein n=1 Tax=Halotalea alkalilenta TaxID=376489 RepID=UPI000486F8B0|nr:hypothetical protein [Halotalea alkalilenta]
MRPSHLFAGARRSRGASLHRERQPSFTLHAFRRELRAFCWLAAALLVIGLISALPALFIWIELIRPD